MNATHPAPAPRPIRLRAAAAGRSGSFRSVRGSRDVSLVAFAGALLLAFAVQLGAFLPRLPSSGAKAAPAQAGAIAPPPAAAGPAVVAGERGPCPAPRG